MSTPKISALLAVYNTKAEYLRETINSILAQELTDFELLIIDDGSSSPEIRQVLAEYSDPRIVVKQNERNLGIGGTRNKLFDLARGEYLAIVDHDDISTPDRFKKQAEFLDSHPEVGVVGSFIRNFPNNILDKYPADNDTIEEMLTHHKRSVLHPATMLRRSVIAEHDIRYKPEFAPAEDYQMFCELIGKTKFANIQETLLHYRWNKQNTSYTQQYRSMYITEKIRQAAAEAHPAIWIRGRGKIVKLYHYTLFGFIPLMTVREQGRKTLYLLFGVLPVLKRKYKGSVSWDK